MSNYDWVNLTARFVRGNLADADADALIAMAETLKELAAKHGVTLAEIGAVCMLFPFGAATPRQLVESTAKLKAYCALSETVSPENKPKPLSNEEYLRRAIMLSQK